MELTEHQSKLAIQTLWFLLQEHDGEIVIENKSELPDAENISIVYNLEGEHLHLRGSLKND